MIYSDFCNIYPISGSEENFILSTGCLGTVFDFYLNFCQMLSFTKGEKNVCLKKLLCSSANWDCREFFWARFKDVFGLVTTTFASIDHKCTLDISIYRNQN